MYLNIEIPDDVAERLNAGGGIFRAGHGRPWRRKSTGRGGCISPT
jgi:hypothetical protein